MRKVEGIVLGPIVALAVSIGITGTVATYIFLSIGTIQIWIAFIGWASFFHCGGGVDGFRKSMMGGIWGSLLALIALLAITQIDFGIPSPLWPSMMVGFTVMVLVLGTRLDDLKVIPAAIYGYAATAGYGLVYGASISSINSENPFFNASLSLIIGGVFGFASEKLAKVLAFERL